MVLEKVQAILAEQLGVEESAVTLTATLMEDLGADSLDVVELIMAIEEEFGIEIGEGDAEGISTVGDLVDYVTEHQA